MLEAVFKAFCASCHEPDFHSGEKFRSSWHGRTLLDYFRNVKATMPQDNPGGLSDDDYVRVIRFGRYFADAATSFSDRSIMV